MKKLLFVLLFALPFASFSQSEFQKDLAAMIKMNSDKVIGLAEAIPEENYSWAPAEGVRDVNSVIMHIAGANYFFPTFAGVNPPAGIDPRNLPSSNKAETIASLKASYEHVMKAIASVSDDALGKEVDFFGNKMNVRMALLLAFGHCEEHMGQLIADARSNNITPPWSE